MLTTSIIGPFFTQRLLPRMLAEEPVVSSRLGAIEVADNVARNDPKLQ